jgi:hypothetical protein
MKQFYTMNYVQQIEHIFEKFMASAMNTDDSAPDTVLTDLYKM